MNSKFLKQKYSEWCKETRRNGAVLVGGSIDDFFEWLDESCPPPVSAEVVSHNEWFNSQSDVRQLLLLHPDGEMIERSCLHFLGDDAQAWWVNRKSSPSAPVVAEQVVTLLELEPGELFEFDGTIALKSEYRTEKGAVESYIVGSGEMFWGGTDTAEALNNLLVKRISLHSPAERIEGDAVDCVYEIDFGGNLKCRMKIVGNKINVEAAMNGWGDGISIDEIKITELKTPHHE